ncbi:MAG: hypothetical protein IJ136_07250 [Erysipelotrichaceae bacterium]|nr:hypothetical protein [Erysipelotrichaceae bacterium]
MLVFVGMVALKRPVYEAVASMVKAVVGYFILSIGSGGFTSTFRPIVNALASKFNITAALIDTYTQQAQMNDPVEGFFASYPDAMGYIMIAFVISIVVNFVLVGFGKYTKIRTLFTTGHIIQSYSLLWFWMIIILRPESYNMLTAVVLGIFCGVWASVGSNFTVEATQKLTGGANFAVGHQEMLGILLTSKLAPKLGKEEDNFENLKMPGWLSIFSDNIVSTSLLMLLFMGIVMLIIGPETMSQFDASYNTKTWYALYIFKTCLHFAVYMNILLSGVRLFVGELVGIGLLLVFKAPILLLPAFIPLFFDNATLACFANRYGGRRAAVILPLLNGLFQVAVSELMLLFFQNNGFNLQAWGAFFDNNSLLPALLLGVKAIGPVPWMLILSVVLLGAAQLYYKKNQEHYWDHVDELED